MAFRCGVRNYVFSKYRVRQAGEQLDRKRNTAYRRTSIPRLSFAKTPRRLSVFHVTCYTASLHVIHCKGALNFGEGQESTSFSRGNSGPLIQEETNPIRLFFPSRLVVHDRVACC